MVGSTSKIALFAAVLQCTAALRRSKGSDPHPVGDRECALPEPGEEEFLSDIPEVDNVTYYDQVPPFLVAFWAPWCPWSRRFVTNGGSDAPIEQLNRELQGSGVGVLKYNGGGRGLPRVPRPPGFDHPYIPTVYLVTTDGSKVRYEGDPTDVQRLAGFARGEQLSSPSDSQAPWAQACSDEEEERQDPQFVSEIPEIDNVTYYDQTPPSLITFWAPWCPWSRKFVTNGGSDAPIEQLNRELQGSGVGVLKYNIGGRGLPWVPEPPGFEWPYVPVVFREAADGTKVRYEGDTNDVQLLAAFARGEQLPGAGKVEVQRGCAVADVPMTSSDIPEIDDTTYSSLTPPFLITFWAPWCPWSRRFVTDGGSDAPIEQAHRGLEAGGGPAIVKYNVGGRGSPRVPSPPGFSFRGIPTVFKVAAGGTKTAYQGDPADVDTLIAWAMQ